MDFLIFTDFVTLNKFNAPTQRKLPIRNIGPQRIRTFLKQKLGLNGLVIDFCFEFSKEEMSQIFLKFVTNDTKFIGISTSHMLGLGQNELDKLLFICQLANESNIPIIFGGTRKSLDTDHTDNEKIFDQIEKIKVYGFGENAILEAIKDKTPRKIDGDWEFKYDDMTNLDCYLDDMSFLHKSETTSFIELARGCIFSCGFCDYPYLNKKKNDYIRDKENLYLQMKHDWDLGIRRYFACDSTFNENSAKYEHIKYAYQKLGNEMDMSGFMRLDLIKNVEDIDGLIDCGFSSFFFGIESWNEKARNACSKHLGDNAKIERTIEMIRNRYEQRNKKLHIFASFIIGLPYDTKESVINDTKYLATNKIFDCFYHHKLKIAEVEKLVNPNNPNLIKLVKAEDLNTKNIHTDWTKQRILDTHVEILDDTVYSKNVNPFSGIFLFNFQALGENTIHNFTREDMDNANMYDYNHDSSSIIYSGKMAENAQFVISQYKNAILKY